MHIKQFREELDPFKISKRYVCFQEEDMNYYMQKHKSPQKNVQYSKCMAIFFHGVRESLIFRDTSSQVICHKQDGQTANILRTKLNN